MKLSVFTVVMGEYGLEGAAQELAALGYDGVEWRVHEDFHIRPGAVDKQAPEVWRLTEGLGLEVPSLGTYVGVHRPDDVERCCRAAAGMRCPGVRIGLRDPYDGEARFDRLFGQARDDLANVRPVLQRHGVRGLLETHHGSIIESASGARRLLEGLSPETFGVIFDPANMVIAGREGWRMGVDVLGEYLALVHVKNISWARDEAGAWQWRYDTLEDGMVDWPDVIRALSDAGYAGYLSVEDLFGTSLRTRGFAGEAIGDDSEHRLPTRQKLRHDLAFLRSCLGSG